jgi:hypothetical protein
MIMTEQANLFDRAADCERLMEAAFDPTIKETFKQLRDMWIMLANQSPAMSADYATEQIAGIESLQRGLSQ